MNRIQILTGNYDLELLIGAIKKGKEEPAGAGYELAFRWDEDMLIRKLRAKMIEKLHNDVILDRKTIKDFDKFKKYFDLFLDAQSASVKEIVDEFVEEVRATKITC